jgi:4-hydroxy-3-methylbut-2-enyl diphosphate reductase
LVAKVHNEVRRYAGRGDSVFLIGHAEHEEVQGTRGEAADDVLVVEDLAQAEIVRPRDPERVAYVMQTTLAVDEAEEIAGVLRSRFPRLRAPRREDICYATTNRQQAVRSLASDCDLVLVVGSANSSNAARLVEVAERAGARAELIEDEREVRLSWLAGARRVGVTAAASTPPHLVERAVAAFSGFGAVAVEERPTKTENVNFPLPVEVR